LPAEAPKSEGGRACNLCLHECRIGEGERSYCGLRAVQGGKRVGGEIGRATVHWYHDPLPTNCVADWVCPGGTGAGYPEFARRPGPETGYTNLAVFYGACTFDCLYCQNWHFRLGGVGSASAEELAEAVDERTACICYFGGDPTPQLPHALKASRLARDKGCGPLRICWETNGSMRPALLDRMLALSLESGGCVKFDLKAYSAEVHFALTGVDNARTLANFRRAATQRTERPVPPLLVAATLLVPGYVEAEEVGQLARFIADLDPEMPYSLLCFHPDFAMGDLPTTRRGQLEECLAATREAGLTNVHVGNPWLARD